MTRGLLMLTVGLMMATCAEAAGPQVGVPWAQARGLVQPKPVSFDTVLIREGQPVAAIVAPEGAAWQELARKLQARTGVPIVPAASLVSGPVDAWTPEALKPLSGGGRNLILLGDLNTNPVIRRLYTQWLAFEDGAYPGKDGHTVRTVVDPEGLGWNAIVLGGPSVIEVAKASEVFRNGLRQDGGSLVAPYTLSVNWGAGSQATNIKNRAESVIAQREVWERFLLDPAGAEYKQFRPNHGAFEWAQDLLNVPFTYGAMHYAVSGQPELAQMAGRAIDTLYEQMDWVETNRTVSWDAHYSWEIWTRAWQQVAQCPLLTDEQRARGAALFGFFAGQMCMYQWPLDSYGKTTYRSLSRHEYAGIFAGDALCRQMLKHTRVQPPLSDLIAANRANFGVVIDTMLGDYMTGFDHKWGLDGNWNLLQAAVEEPRPRFVTSGMARLCADYATMMIDNTGRFVNYGSDNVAPLEKCDAWQVLGRAEAIFRDDSYRWWTSRYLNAPYKTFILIVNYLGHWFEPPRGEGEEPSRFLGLNRLPLSRHIVEDLKAGRGRLYAGLPVVNDVAHEHGFNKLTMRDGLSPDDQYLLLDGLGGVTYSGNDAGAICAYSRYGERLLVQIENKPDPFYQNFVSVARGNALEPTGTFARLTDAVDLGPAMYVRLEVEPLCGAKAVRHLFMEKGQFCLAFDDVTVKEEDEYAITSTWRALGTPSREPGREFVFANEKARLRLSNVVLPGSTAPQYTLTDRTSGATPEDQSFKIRVLRETVARRFEAGETQRFANMWWAQKTTEPPRVHLSSEPISGSAVRVLQLPISEAPGPGYTGFAAAQEGVIHWGPRVLQAAACRVTHDQIQLIRTRQLSDGPVVLFKLASAVTMNLDHTTRRLTVQSPESKQVGTINCEPTWRVTASWDDVTKRGIVLPGGVALKMDVMMVFGALSVDTTTFPPLPQQSLTQPAQLKPPRQILTAAAALNDLCLADIDGDGAAETVAVTPDGHVIATDLRGRERFNVTLGDESLLSCWAGKLGGQMTILAGGEKGVLVALDAAGKVLWRTRNARWWYGPGPAIYSLAVGDFAGDGSAMIACGTHGGGSLFDAKGQFVSFTQTYSHAMKPLQAVSLYGGKEQWVLGSTWGHGLKLWQPMKQQIVEPWFQSWGRVAHDLTVVPVGEDLWFAYAGPHGVAGARLDRTAWLAGQRDRSVWADHWYIRSDGETTALLPLDLTGDGVPEIMTANETGFLVWYTLKGERLGKQLVGMQVQDMALHDTNGDGQPELVLAGENPHLLVLDRQLKPVGAWRAEGAPLQRVFATEAGVLVRSGTEVFALGF